MLTILKFLFITSGSIEFFYFINPILPSNNYENSMINERFHRVEFPEFLRLLMLAISNYQRLNRALREKLNLNFDPVANNFIYGKST